MTNTKAILQAAVLFLGAASPAFAHLPPEGFPLREACVVEGAAELRAELPEPTAAEQEIMDAEWQSCRMLGDPNTIEQALDHIVAEEGRVLLMNGGIANSKAEQQAMFKSYFEMGYDIVYEPIDAVVSESGDIGWAIGLIKETKPNGATELGKYVSVWHKIEGKWLNVIEMRNSNGATPLVLPK